MKDMYGLSLQDFRFEKSLASNISGIYPTREHHKIYDYVILIVLDWNDWKVRHASAILCEEIEYQISGINCRLLRFTAVFSVGEERCVTTLKTVV